MLGRFANSALGHRTVQVAMDGTSETPAAHTGHDHRPPQSRSGSRVRVSWSSQRGCDSCAATPTTAPRCPWTIHSPSVIRAALAAAADTAQGTADALFALTEVFGELGADPQVRAGVVDWLVVLDRHGVSGALQSAGGAR